MRRDLSISGAPRAVVIADLVEQPFAGRLDIARSEALVEAVDLREGALDIDRGRFAADELAFSLSLPFNEFTLAIREQKDGEWIIGVSRYSAFCAAREQFTELPEERRLEVVLSGGLGIPPAFGHTLGVNCSLETSDGQMIYTTRSILNTTTEGLHSIAVSENANTGDLDGDAYDPMRTALRGFEEELGMSSDELQICFHSLIAQLPDGQHSIVGHAVTQLTAAEVFARQALAKDSGEARSIHAVEFTTKAIERLLEDHEWVSWGPPALLGALRI